MTLHLPFERNDIATKWPFTHASAWAEKLKSAAASLTEKKQDASDDALSAELVVKDHSQTKSYPIDVVPDGMGDAKILQLDSLHTKDLIFFDKKLENTAFIESAITYIDGENKILLYRGYPIEQLAKSSTYLETAYLLRDGELPDEEEYAVYKKRVLENMKVDPDMLNILKSYPPGTPPMLLINIMLSSMGAFYRDFGTRNTEEGRDNITTNLVAKTPAIVAAAIRASRQKTPEDLKNL
ncbi:MAG: citrate/2-methylcitrate synthase, partial [Alphaproteobacteria bacterium]|nr:citrate/2-methylcitrate synthase [Alphaproteobacteria bacterium]